MDVKFSCPVCQRPSRLRMNADMEWVCPRCEHSLEIGSTDDVSVCVICGNPELYRKKDFPQWLGQGILMVAFVVFLVSQYFYRRWLAWGVLIGSAVVDGLLYVSVGDAAVCYRCGAHHRGCAFVTGFNPFELGIAERYRQERLRKLRIQAEGNDNLLQFGPERSRMGTDFNDPDV